MSQNYISYIRVSTARQGNSGLGMEAQKQAVASFVNGGDWNMISEFDEIESGKRSDRPKLDEALIECRIHNAVLVVAKVDRLTRSVYFLQTLLNSGVEVAFCDLPEINGPTGKFMLNQMAAVAELEAGLISQRTKAALAAVKAKGVKLGNPRSIIHKHYKEGAANSARVRSDKADRRAMDLSVTIKNMGDISANQIAKNLNKLNIKTARGCQWQANQVIALKKRIS